MVESLCRGFVRVQNTILQGLSFAPGHETTFKDYQGISEALAKERPGFARRLQVDMDCCCSG